MGRALNRAAGEAERRMAIETLGLEGRGLREGEGQGEEGEERTVIASTASLQSDVSRPST